MEWVDGLMVSIDLARKAYEYYIISQYVEVYQKWRYPKTMDFNTKNGQSFDGLGFPKPLNIIYTYIYVLIYEYIYIYIYIYMNI